MNKAESYETAVLDPELLLDAYRQGLFPMADSKEGEIHWYTADPRGILDLDEFRIPRSLRRTVKKQRYEIRIDTAFGDVIARCADRSETWISRAIIDGYTGLHRMGMAHSVESWEDGELCGGLYGVSIGGAFFGESMFTLRPDASKVALVHLVARLRERGYLLLDTQMVTTHMRRFGAKEIPQAEYLERLQRALLAACRFN